MLQGKMYYSIEEVAKYYSTTCATIRNWSTWFNLEVKRNSSNNRRFSNKNVHQIERIATLLRLECYTVRGAVRQIALFGWKLKLDDTEFQKLEQEFRNGC